MFAEQYDPEEDDEEEGAKVSAVLYSIVIAVFLKCCFKMSIFLLCLSFSRLCSLSQMNRGQD